MKIKLLKKLREEATEYYRFRVTHNNFCTWAFVEGNNITTQYFSHGLALEKANTFCKNKIREYVISQVRKLKGGEK